MTTTESSKPKVRTVTLTGQPPVRIREDLWPVIASARRYDGQVECQANHLWHLTVRQHEDGRTIVYGSETSGPGGVYRGYEEARAGELLDAGADVASAIIRVGTDARCSKAMQDECIGDLPAVDIAARWSWSRRTRRQIGSCEVCGETLLQCQHREGTMLRALLAVEWIEEYGSSPDWCPDVACNAGRPKHADGCRLDAAITAAGLATQAERDAARAEIAASMWLRAAKTMRANSDLAVRMEQEAQILASMNHPHISSEMQLSEFQHGPQPPEFVNGMPNVACANCGEAEGLHGMVPGVGYACPNKK